MHISKQLFKLLQVSFIALTLSLFANGVIAAEGDLDTSFNPSSGADGSVRASVVQTDGKIIIGGIFTTVNGVARSKIARLNSDGSLDTSFDPGSGVNNWVYTSVLQADGKIVIAGSFTTVNGTSRNRIARLNADGSLDTSFNPGTGANNSVFTSALQTDGKIIIGGPFTAVNGTTRNYIARLNADGSLDTSFTPNNGGPDGQVRSTKIQADGKIIIGGDFSWVNGVQRNRIARLNADASLDTGFNAGAITGITIVYTSVIQADAKIVIGGTFTAVNGTARNRIARLNADGSLDTGFNPGSGVDSAVQTSAVQADGKIIIGGAFTNVNGTARNRIARLNADGSLDTGFNPGSGANSTVQTSIVQADNKVLIAGDFTAVNGTTRNYIARIYTSDGAMAAAGDLDTSFNPGSDLTGSIAVLALQPNDKILMGGDFTTVNGVTRHGIARLNVDGSLDSTFNPNLSAVLGLAVQADGKILVGGYFGHNVARLNANGTLDTTFDTGSGASDIVRALAVQPDGKVLIGGDFGTVNGVSRKRIARLNADGSLDTTFNPGSGVAGNGLYSLVLQPDGKVLIGGCFNTVNGVIRRVVARLDVDGSLDTSFNANFSTGQCVRSIKVQPDGKVLIGGNFYSVNGVARNYIARLNTDGSLDMSFNAIAPWADVISLALQADGKIIESARGRLNTDGSLDTSFPASGYIGIVAIQPDGKILLARDYYVLEGTTSIVMSRIVRIHSGDQDADSVEDAVDNCSSVANADQTDTDGDAQGNTCDSDDDNDDLPDVWEITYGLNPLVNDANGDLDGDGITNLQEYLNGSNPTTKPVKNDFSPDGKADILLRNITTGNWNLVQLNGLSILNQSTVGAFSDIENVIVSTADFDGDGDADILTRGTDDGLLPGTFRVELTAGATVAGSAWLVAMSTDTNDIVMSTKDFNKDGKADVLLRNSATGVWTMNYMNGANDPIIGALNASIDLCYTMKGDGDYDGNGYPDLLLRKDACGGASYPWLVSTTDGDFTILATGAPGVISMNTTWAPVVTDKDFNSDGKSDVLMRAMSGSVQQWLLYDMNGAGAPSASGLLNIPVQSMWQFASAADFNGDGKADVLLRSTDTGQWYADLLNGRTILGAGVPSLAMNPIWILQALDDNSGDGKNDILLRNSAGGQWWLYLMNGLTVQSNSSLPITTDLNYVLQND